MKKLMLLLFVMIFALSCFSVTAFAEDEEIVESVADDAAADNGLALGDMNFQPEGFARNLKYMGLGMLGIFVVVVVVILITFCLNTATGKKK